MIDLSKILRNRVAANMGFIELFTVSIIISMNNTQKKPHWVVKTMSVSPSHCANAELDLLRQLCCAYPLCPTANL
jgi:hypothetical protein